MLVRALHSQALPTLAVEFGVSAQELSLEEVVPTTVSTGMLDDGKLDLVMVTVPETATVEVRNDAGNSAAKLLVLGRRLLYSLPVQLRGSA